jgi:hypothetical protein
MDWIHVAQDSDQWLILREKVTYFLIPRKISNFFLVSEQLLASQEGFTSIELVVDKLLHRIKYYLMGLECNTHVKYEKSIRNFSLKSYWIREVTWEVYM